MNAVEYGAPVKVDAADGQVEALLQGEPGKPGQVLLGVAQDGEGAAMVSLTVAAARELSAALARLADESIADPFVL